MNGKPHWHWRGHRTNLTIIDHFSSSDFHEGSRGYRLGATWGDQQGPQLTAGTDLNYVKQELIENLRLHFGGKPVATRVV